MKKLFIIAAVVALAVACADPNAYTVKGDIAGFEGRLYLLDSEQGNAPVDSVDVVGGKFEFKGVTQHPQLASITDVVGQGDATLYCNIFLEPGTITINGSFEDVRNVVLGGTPANEGFTAFRVKDRELRTAFADAQFDTEKEQISQQHDDMVTETFEQNKTNLFGAVVLVQYLAYNYTGSEMLEKLNTLPEELQNTKIVRDARQLAEAKSRVEPGKPYIEIVMNDTKGKELKLSDVLAKNKYVLVDFWASWCGPCMGEMPYLTEAYAKYHKAGFEIFGVSLDSTSEAWMRAINGKKLNWLHVSELKGWDCQSAKEYAVRSIPSNFLIDCATGNIVAVNLRGEKVLEELASLLK